MHLLHTSNKIIYLSMNTHN